MFCNLHGLWGFTSETSALEHLNNWHNKNYWLRMWSLYSPLISLITFQDTNSSVLDFIYSLQWVYAVYFVCEIFCFPKNIHWMLLLLHTLWFWWAMRMLFSTGTVTGKYIFPLLIFNLRMRSHKQPSLNSKMFSVHRREIDYFKDFWEICKEIKAIA